MRRKQTAVCLAGAAMLLAGCSEGSGGNEDSVDKTEDGAMVTVKYQVTGDSPASAYSPGITSEPYTGKRSDSEPDLDVEGLKTPWSKKFHVKPGRHLTLQVASEDPQEEIGCRILVNGKVVDQQTKQNKPGYTLTSSCDGNTPQ